MLPFAGNIWFFCFQWENPQQQLSQSWNDLFLAGCWGNQPSFDVFLPCMRACSLEIKFKSSMLQKEDGGTLIHELMKYFRTKIFVIETIATVMTMTMLVSFPKEGDSTEVMTYWPTGPWNRYWNTLQLILYATSCFRSIIFIKNTSCICHKNSVTGLCLV